MRLAALTCEVLARSVYLCAARSPHVVDVRWTWRGLQDDPARPPARPAELAGDPSGRARRDRTALRRGGPRVRALRRRDSGPPGRLDPARRAARPRPHHALPGGPARLPTAAARGPLPGALPVSGWVVRDALVDWWSAQLAVAKCDEELAAVGIRTAQEVGCQQVRLRGAGLREDAPRIVGNGGADAAVRAGTRREVDEDIVDELAEGQAEADVG